MKYLPTCESNRTTAALANFDYCDKEELFDFLNDHDVHMVVSSSNVK